MEKENFWLKIIYILSAVLSLAVGFLILGPRPEGIEGAIDVSSLPFVNAFLNLVTTILLVIGYVLIKQKKREQHRSVMLSAFFTSALFLVSYVVYHWFKSGPKPCRGAWFHLLSGTPNSHSTSDVNFAFSNDKRLQRYGFTNSAAQKNC